MTKKYELTNEKIEYENRTLYRIRALRDFEDVKMGDLGGFVEHKKNLSHSGDCWIYDDSKVIGFSKIVGYSKVKCKSIVDNSIIYNSIVKTSIVKISKVKNYSTVDNSVVKNCSIVKSSTVMNYSIVDNSTIESSTVKSHSIVKSYSEVRHSIIENSKVKDSSSIIDYSRVKDSKVDGSSVMGESKVDYSTIKDSTVGANKCRFDNAKIESDADYIAIANIGSRKGTLTAYRCADGKIGVATGCFKGSIDEFVDAVKETHGDNTYGIQYLKAVELIKHVLMCGETVTKGNDYEHQTSN